MKGRKLMKKIIFSVVVFLFCLCLLVSCINGSTAPKDENSVNVSQDTSIGEEMWEYSDGEPFPEIPKWEKRSGATKEEAEKTVLLTDKESYKTDDTIIITIKPYDPNDAFAFGFNYKVEYFDESTEEWKDTGKEYSYTEELCMTMGETEQKFKFSDRANDIGEKYRIVWNDVQVNGYFVDLISNEFTVD